MEDQAPGEIVVKGKSRFGELVLVSSNIASRSIFVIVDSGSQSTVGNLALRSLISSIQPADTAPSRSSA